MSVVSNCLLCAEPANVIEGDRGVFVACKHCGKYELTEGALVCLERNEPPEKWKLSAYACEKLIQKLPKPVFFARQEVLDERVPPGSVGLDAVESTLPKTVADRLDRTLLNLAGRARYLGDLISMTQKD